MKSRSRFAREIAGEYGEYWMKNAIHEAENLLARKKEIKVDPDGAASWISSGNYLPEDVVEKLVYAGADFFSPDATKIARENQTKIFLEKYRIARRDHKYSDEEVFELRSAFGNGKTIVDIVTGETIVL